MATPKLKNSPIIEVVCEFRFELENPNDATLPGRLYDIVKNEFPIIKNRNLGTVLPNDGNTNQAELLLTPLAQFYNLEENLLLQVGHNMLAVNSIKKYPTWEIFKPVILDSFRQYSEIAKPKSIVKIILQCINKIHIDSKDFQLSDYFLYYPPSPGNITEPLTAFNMHIDTLLNHERDILTMINFSVLPDNGKEGQSAFILDLRYTMNKSGTLQFDQIDNWLETAHDELYKAFNASITEKLLNHFNI
jgi:uncharacterized protein (TIGR04255 family)